MSVKFWVVVVPRAKGLKVSVPGLPVERVAMGASPVPFKVTVCGLPVALSATLTTDVRRPSAVGANVA